MKGNCFTWAIGALMECGFRGSLAVRIVEGFKLRCYFIDCEGYAWYFYPLHPRNDWKRFFHWWFEGKIREGKWPV